MGCPPGLLLVLSIKGGIAPTSNQAIVPSRCNESVKPFSESPGMPYTRRTPARLRVSTIKSDTVNDTHSHCVVDPLNKSAVSSESAHTSGGGIRPVLVNDPPLTRTVDAPAWSMTAAGIDEF